ncbi:GDSL esterase/lipase At5g45920 [Cucurbita maxima]|uniref:GDSL esterase/lipase At5g45920 n=1 Tax=Cucurbita maxima TaxID=3661 RepID=A0A6J1IU69_CUCMA|nr:GDSL esterase/lipase At5g45920 [Cucurbita maxima]
MRPRIYLFGDSITEFSFADGGWGAALANHFSRRADVVVRGYSGYNTRWALKVIEHVFPASEEHGGAGDPLALTVFFGANDACLPDRYGAFQHVPLDEYKQNLISIVSFLKKQWPATRILLITPPPIDEEGRLQNPYIVNPLNEPERTNNAAGDYAKACIAVAAECGVSVIDIWTKMQQLPGWEKACLSDGLHLSRNGNTIVFEEVVQKLKEEGLSPEMLPADLPLLSEIDYNDPLKAFEELR